MGKFFVVVFAAFAVSSQALTWRNCEMNAPAKITKMDVQPDILPFREGATITASGEMINTASPPNDATYKIVVKAYRKVWVWVPIPCIKFIGSCTYETLSCQMLKDKFPLLDLPCPLPVGKHTLLPNTVTVP